jgi:hypothetical protein
MVFNALEILARMPASAGGATFATGALELLDMLYSIQRIYGIEDGIHQMIGI